MRINKFQNLDLKQKRVLLRVDFNVPLKKGKIEDDTRIIQTLPTFHNLLKQKAKIIVVSHLGRPEGKKVASLNMKIIATHLGKLLKKPVKKLDECVGQKVKKAVLAMKPGEIILLENVRFYSGEEKNDQKFASELASLGEVYISDSFATAHRAHATTAAIAKYLPCYAGFLMQKEIETLSTLSKKVRRPLTVIIGGAKIETKIGILENFMAKADYFLIGGGLANTFLAAEGYNVGKSLYQADKIKIAQNIMLKAEALGDNFVLPEDVIVADEIKKKIPTLDIPVEDVTDNMKILDVGTQTLKKFIKIIRKSKTVIWNGPVGLSELKPFQNGTLTIAKTLVWYKDSLKSIIGGGDTLEAVKRFGFKENQFGFVSTGGAAMVEFLEGKKLPGVEIVLAQR